jgi:hypothetical protein
MMAEKRKGVGRWTKKKKEEYKITQLKCTQKIQTNEKFKHPNQNKLA